MALKEVFVEENPFKAGEIIVFIAAECPRKPEGCTGEVEMTFELAAKNTARWGSNPRPDVCSECGVVMGLNNKMLSEAFARAEESLKEKGLPMPENL